MTAGIPRPVEEKLRDLCLVAKAPAFLRVRSDGRLGGWGGDCARYGLSGLRDDGLAADQVLFLGGMLPLKGKSLSLPSLYVGENRYADVHLFPGEESDWVLLLDTSAETLRRLQLQQSANELALVREQLSKSLAQVRLNHEQLLSVFNQLRLITLIVDDAGRVEFVSQAGQSFLARGASEVVGTPWDRLLPLDGQDRTRIQDLLTQPAAARRRLLVQTRCPGRRRCSLEFDVQDDPRDPSRRIVYIYDVSEIHELRDLLSEKAHFHDLIGGSKAMEQVFQLIRDVSGVEATVLIEGETGTGKELVARAIHFDSPRKEGPFIVVNCAGLSDTLINSQLFGHRKGAFTDAVRDQEGLFEAAQGGTILLDEIGDIPMNTQTRILRVLEEKEITRIGDTRPRKIDIRILAATNKDLEQEVSRGHFRADLLYRIRVARVSLPSLRERREDIPLLVESFLGKSRAATGKAAERLDDESLRLVMDYAWPGNVRELRNAIEFAVIRCRGGVIQPDDLPPEVRRPPVAVSPRREYEFKEERQRILDALEKAKGRRDEAARMLGMSRATLYRRMRVCMLTPAR